MIRAALAAVVAAALVACGTAKPGGMNGPSMSGSMNSQPVTPTPSSAVVSADILAREPVANSATVKHILISWKDLADNFQGHIDPRAAKRTKTDAETEVKEILTQLKGGVDFDTIMRARSEDLGSAQSGTPFTVTPDAQLVIEFRQLGLRLHIGEIGVCQSDFGFHIMKRLD